MRKLIASIREHPWQVLNSVLLIAILATLWSGVTYPDQVEATNLWEIGSSNEVNGQKLDAICNQLNVYNC